MLVIVELAQVCDFFGFKFNSRSLLEIVLMPIPLEYISNINFTILASFSFIANE